MCVCVYIQKRMYMCVLCMYIYKIYMYKRKRGTPSVLIYINPIIAACSGSSNIAMRKGERWR